MGARRVSTVDIFGYRCGFNGLSVSVYHLERHWLPVGFIKKNGGCRRRMVGFRKNGGVHRRAVGFTHPIVSSPR